MGTVEIVDNFLEKELCIFLHEYFLKMPHYYGHSSKPNENNANSFYMTDLNIQDPLINFLCRKIFNQKKKNITILRTYINVQHVGMNGEFHDDDGDNTYLIMISKTLQENSGQFQIIDTNDTIRSINFVQNRLISFPAKLKHRGLAPLEGTTPRITLVFKTESIHE
jgi:hypothetical protein